MGDRIRSYDCEICGTPCRRYRRNQSPKVCVECATVAMVAYATAMVAREGPAWEAHQRNPGGRPRRSPSPTE